MYFKLKCLVFITLFGMPLGSSFAQVQHSQINKISPLINPAFSNYKGEVQGTLYYRKQWAEISDSPSSESFNIHYHDEKLRGLGFGLTLTNYHYGFYNNFDAYFSISYKLKLQKSSLSFGIQGGPSSFFLDRHKIISDVEDPSYSNNQSFNSANIGFGMFYSTNRFNIGASVPEVFKLEDRTYATENEKKEIDFKALRSYLYSSYRFSITPDIFFVPTILVLIPTSTSMNVNITAYLNLLNKVNIGIGLRSKEALIFSLDYKLNNYTIGYSYDYILTDINKISSGSHEIVFSFNFNNQRTKRVDSIRYF